MVVCSKTSHVSWTSLQKRRSTFRCRSHCCELLEVLDEVDFGIVCTQSFFTEIWVKSPKNIKSVQFNEMLPKK